MDIPTYVSDHPNYDMDGPNYGFPSFFFRFSVLRLLGGFRRLASANTKTEQKNLGGRQPILNSSLCAY